MKSLPLHITGEKPLVKIMVNEEGRHKLVCAEEFCIESSKPGETHLWKLICFLILLLVTGASSAWEIYRVIFSMS